MTTRATLEKALSRRQQDVYDFIRFFIEDNGYAPTIREIADGIMLASSSTVHSHVNSLIRKGYLTNSSGGVRTLVLTKKGKRPKVVTQAGIMKWIQDQGIEETHDAAVYKLLTDLQEGIRTGRIC
ncbi:repressor LexA [Paenibacillus sp. 4624]|uniref:LexA family protein n=1 Tax=Paenibacillus sp. 4624 TaxID=3156453 RepID=UPI003D20BE83